jgi:protoporphyrinogen oxidase
MPTDHANSQSWAILGGGMLGLTLAHRLAQAGRRVSVFEPAAELGGMASAWNFHGITWDRHYHVTLLSDTPLREILKELGLDEQMQWVTTRTGFFMDGKLYSMSNSLEFLRFPPLSLIDKFRLGATIAYAARIRRADRLEKIGVAQWLTRLSGKNVFAKMWQPLLRAKLGENYTQASAAFIWAIIARMYAARRSGLKEERFGYLPGGYGRLLDAFRARLEQQGVEIHLNATAASVTAHDGAVDVTLTNGQSHRFDQAVLTMASPAAATLCPQLSQRERLLHNGIAYQGIVCASVLLRQPLGGYYVTNLIDDWVPFTAVIEMSALVDRAQFAGNHLVYLPKYVDPTDPLFDRTDEEIRQLFIPALRRMYPALAEEDVLAFQVSRVRRVLPIPTLNYSAKLPPMHTSIPGVHIVNSTHIVNGTLNVNETVQLANAAAKEMLAMPVAPARSAAA